MQRGLPLVPTPQGRLRARVQVLDRHHSQAVGHLVREAHGAVDESAAVLRGERKPQQPLGRSQPRHAAQRAPAARALCPLMGRAHITAEPGDRGQGCPRLHRRAPSQGSPSPPTPRQSPPQPEGPEPRCDSPVHPGRRSRRTVLEPMRSAVMEREVTRIVAEPAPSSTAAPYISAPICRARVTQEAKAKITRMPTK